MASLFIYIFNFTAWIFSNKKNILLLPAAPRLIFITEITRLIFVFLCAYLQVKCNLWLHLSHRRSIKKKQNINTAILTYFIKCQHKSYFSSYSDWFLFCDNVPAECWYIATKYRVIFLFIVMLFYYYVIFFSYFLSKCETTNLGVEITFNLWIMFYD